MARRKKRYIYIYIYICLFQRHVGFGATAAQFHVDYVLGIKTRFLAIFKKNDLLRFVGGPINFQPERPLWVE